MNPRFKRILAATGNPNKLRELQTVGARFDIDVLNPNDLGLGEPPDPEETGTTYLENARIKAEAFHRWSGLPSLGDDSGLEVTALDNIPGLYSARFMGPDVGYPERMQKLIDDLQAREKETGEKNRQAFYHCALILADNDNVEMQQTSNIEGTILDEFRGAGGFGYDPIFLINSLGQTFAEIDFSVTCTHGFRAVAATELFTRLCQA